MIVVTMFLQPFGHDPPTTISNEEIFHSDFLLILKKNSSELL